MFGNSQMEGASVWAFNKYQRRTSFRYSWLHVLCIMVLGDLDPRGPKVRPRFSEALRTYLEAHGT